MRCIVLITFLRESWTMHSRGSTELSSTLRIGPRIALRIVSKADGRVSTYTRGSNGDNIYGHDEEATWS